MPSPLKNSRGQGVIEYILVLVVAVGLILGGVYQLNSAFKSWANNYFGDYLACLLETGELPSISGTGGDSGVCNSLFKPFSLADGRPLITSDGTKGPGAAQSSNSEARGGSGGGGGSRESSDGANRSRVSGGGGSGGQVGRFGSINPSSSSSGSGRMGNKKGNDSTNTGSTAISQYGSGGYNQRRLNAGMRQSLDQQFAFADARDNDERRRSNVVQRSPSESGAAAAKRTRINIKPPKSDASTLDDSGFTFGDFLRFLIIAAIIIAIVLFLGGQALQIGKSMDA